MAGLFDIFSNTNAQDAANAQISGLQNAFNAASGYVNQGSNALTSNYTAGLQPFQTNYAQAQQGTTQLGNALGLNGGAAGAQAQAAAYASNPAFQFQLNQGNQNVLRNAAQTGSTNSGATMLALQNQGQGLANQTYQQYIQNLQPYMGASQNAAAGIGGLYSGLGNQLNQNYGSLSNLAWQEQTGMANAQANADLANNAASANMVNAAGAGISALTSLFSDVRLKEDIEPVGKLYDDTTVYRYRYKGDYVPRIGVMAQEVEKKYPEAVGNVMGFKTVDYGKATKYAAQLAPFLKAA